MDAREEFREWLLGYFDHCAGFSEIDVGDIVAEAREFFAPYADADAGKTTQTVITAIYPALSCNDEAYRQAERLIAAYGRACEEREREACAKTCEEIERAYRNDDRGNVAGLCAAAIRARGEAKP